MDWTDPDALEARVRRLDTERLTALVADLWAARGFETDRDGAYVVARREGTTRVLYVPTERVGTPSPEAGRPVDTVVAVGQSNAGETLAAELGARFVGAGDLTEMLRYAVDRGIAADLCEEYLGAAPGELTIPPRDRAHRAVEGLTLETAVAVLFAAVVVAVGAGTVLGVVGPGVGGSTPAEAAATPGTVTSPGGDGPRTVTVEASPPEAGATDVSPPPGVNEAGINNPGRLAQAHAATVADRSSYTIWFDYYTPANGSTRRVQYDVNVRVDGKRSSVQTWREGIGGTRLLLSTVYFDGTDRYAAANISDEFTRIDSQTPTATPRSVPFTRPGEMVRLYLATPESSVSVVERDTPDTRYRLRGTGRPAALPDTITEYEMTALVDERGFVQTFEAEFSISRDDDGDGVSSRDRVRLTWTYDDLNRTEVGLRA